MGDQSVMPDDLLALFNDIDSATASVFASINSESDVLGLDLDLFVDQNDGPCVNPGPSITTDETSSATMMTTNASSKAHAERCRMNRKRKKQELDELRASADALQATLRQLRSQTADRDPTPSPSWRSVSKRTLLECHKATRENSVLREMLQQQFAAAQGIQRAIAAVPDLQAFPLCLPTEPTSPTVNMSKALCLSGASASTVAPTHQDKQYLDLFKRIHSVYEQKSFDELSWLKIDTRKISMELVTQNGSDCTDMCVQVMECQQLSMSLASVSDATWKHLTTPCSDDEKAQSEVCGRAPLTRYGDDLFGDCGTDCKPVPTEGDSSLGRLAVRRYVDTNRLTFVWECDGCFQCDAAKNPIGRVTERGWCTIEPSNDDPTSSTTVLRIQVQYLPQQSKCGVPGTCEPSRHVNLSSDLALQLYRGTIARTFGAVEKEVFKKKTPSTPANRCC